MPIFVMSNILVFRLSFLKNRSHIMKKLLCLLLASLMVLAGYSEGYDGGLFMDKHNADIDSIKENNKIYYTTIDKSLLQISAKFGPNLVSNTYENGQGVLTFDGAITSIENHAFEGCMNLESITIPDGVTSIGNCAFVHCEFLTSITLPDGLTSIGGMAFFSCKNLASITLPNSVTSIGNLVFANCENLLSITIPDGVTSIGMSSFDYCVNLVSITLPNSVTSIGNRAFYCCKNLASITLPDSVTSIGERAFFFCEKLASITLPDNLTSIGNGAFEKCRKLKEFKGKWASKDGRCLVMERVRRRFVPSYEVTEYILGNFAPYGITEYIIPDGVTSIGNYAFSDCDNLVCLTIPDSVTFIGERAFFFCKNLASITLPNNLTSIGDSAFSYCRKLTELYCKSVVPPGIGDGMLKDVPETLQIYVPIQSVDAYKSAWKNYSNQIVGYNF